MRHLLLKLNVISHAHRQMLFYLLFGVLTTAVNYLSFWLLIRLWPARVLLDNAVTFAAATVFAYLTNKIFVFGSQCWRPGFLLREAASFTAARLASFCVEQVGLYVAVYKLQLGQHSFGPLSGLMAAKIILSALAVALNYLFSKTLVFRHFKGGDPQ